MNWLKHPVFSRFSLLCLIAIVAIALAMGYALSSLLTHAVSEWEWQNTAALVRREVEREGLQRIFTEPGGPGARRHRGLQDAGSAAEHDPLESDRHLGDLARRRRHALSRAAAAVHAG